MSWLRLDDGFTRHPKFAGWTPAQRWALLEVLEYCARYDTDGRIPNDLSLLPRSTTPALLRRAEASGWFDRGPDGGLIVHDWDLYNPPRNSVEQAVVEYLTAHPSASANDVCRDVKGSRKRILIAVSRFRSGSESGSESVLNEDANGSEVVTRAGALARARTRPVPSVLDTDPEPAPDTRHDAGAPHGAGAGAGDDDLDRLDPRAALDRIAAEGTT